MIGKTTMYFKSIGNRHGLRLFLSPHRKETVRYAWMECGNSDGPDERIVDFYQTNFNDKDWTDFPVPANWEINGYGTPIYVSAGYPFKIDPSRVMGGTQGGLCDLSRKESGRAVSAASYGYWQMKV